MTQRKKALLSLIINFIGFFISSFILLLLFYYITIDPEKAFYLRFFTIVSNLLACAAAVLLLPYEFRRAIGKSDTIPKALCVFKFSGTVSVMVTFFVVLIFFSPVGGWSSQFSGVNFYLHALCPILSAVSFIFFDGGCRISGKQMFPAFLPAFLYSIVYFVMCVFIPPSRGGWNDFYHFNAGGLWSVSWFAFLSIDAFLVILLRRFHNRFL